MSESQITVAARWTMNFESWDFNDHLRSSGYVRSYYKVQFFGVGTSNHGWCRNFNIFDTSTIPDNATISSVVLRLYFDTVEGYCNFGAFEVRHVTSDKDLTGTETDFNITNFLSTLLLSVPYNDSRMANGSHDFTLSNYTINLTGYTKIGLIHSYDYAGVDQDNSYEFAMNNGTYPPLLIVTWTTPPVVSTGNVTGLNQIYATLGGDITDVGGGTVSERGVCWGLSANPTTSNSKATSAGGAGAYTVSATGLSPGLTYHYRAYVITENSTQYGSDLTFITPSGAAILYSI